MAQKPALYFAVVRGAHSYDGFEVMRVTSDRGKQFTGVADGNITATTRSIRDLVAKFPDLDTAKRALQAYQDRWNAHSDLVAAAERRLRLERNNRETSAMDALRSVSSGKAPAPLVRSAFGDSVATDPPPPDPEEFQTPSPARDPYLDGIMKRGIRSEADNDGE